MYLFWRQIAKICTRRKIQLYGIAIMPKLNHLFLNGDEGFFMYLATLSTFDNLKRGKILDFLLSYYVCSIKKTFVCT